MESGSIPSRNSVTQAFKSTRLLDQLQERIRYLHCSLRTEEAYVYWARDYIRWHGLRHPRTLGAPEIEAYLAFLANDRNPSSYCVFASYT